MRKFIVLFAVLVVFCVVGATSAKASSAIDYDFVTLDNGMNGLWATDHFHSKVTFTPTTDNCYNVVREDSGTFEVIPGALSPGGDGVTTVGDGTVGEISGGIEVVLCGTLRDEPLPNDTPEDLTTGSYVSYADRYFHRFFSDTPVLTEWISWGWTFTTCNNGTWVDNDETESLFSSIGPNDTMGDINGEYLQCNDGKDCHGHRKHKNDNDHKNGKNKNFGRKGSRWGYSKYNKNWRVADHKGRR